MEYIEEIQDDMYKLLLRAKILLQREHDRCEALHDSYGEMYMDYGLYEIMTECKGIISKTDEIPERLKNI